MQMCSLDAAQWNPGFRGFDFPHYVLLHTGYGNISENY